MADLPSGTVTMLFSDIEGSTLLLSRLGDDYAETLTRHRQLLRRAWRDAGGHEMGTEGDSFFVVFPAAQDAVGAAVAGQQALHEAVWPGGERVRIRMGLHTGEPTRHEDGYVGMDVHRASRVAGAANGGQVVLTDATTALVRDALPPASVLTDLGQHRLKDLAAPEHLFQVSGAGMERDFPALRSLGATTSLPRPRTALLGRDQEVSELVHTLSEPGVRLVTLTGPGGTGKTRLSIAVAGEVAGSAPDGVYFVPLAGATTADAMWATIADQLRVTDDRTPARVLAEIADRRMLLVLDNLEQLAEAGEAIEALLTQGQGVRILATSRRPLHVAGEHEHAVPTLELASEATVDVALQAPAVQLFCQHAAMVRSDFELTSANAGDVAAICRRLDGLPLAIELTAARCKLLSPAALLARLGTALDASSADAGRPARQRSLRETLVWSDDLLEPDVQEFFRRLGVFPGPAGLDAVEAVTDSELVLDRLAVLVDLSLVRMVEAPDGEPRVALLQTIRDFARDELAADGELDATQRRHAAHFAELAERVAPVLVTPRALDAADVLAIEHDNLRAALTWALRPGELGPVPGERRAIGGRICVALWWFWASQGHVVEGLKWFERARELLAGEDSPLMARLLLGLGIWDAFGSASAASARPDYLQEALRMAQRWSDLRTMSEAALTMAQWHARRDDMEEAARLYERSLEWAEQDGDDSLRASALQYYAGLVLELGDSARARLMVEEALTISARNGNERDVVGRRIDLANLQLEAGDAPGAWAALVELVPDAVRLREPALCVEALDSLADIALRSNNLRDGVVLGSARNRWHVEIGWPESVLDRWEAFVAEKGADLEPGVYALAREEGRALSLFDALDYAVQAEPPGGSADSG